MGTAVHSYICNISLDTRRFGIHVEEVILQTRAACIEDKDVHGRAPRVKQPNNVLQCNKMYIARIDDESIEESGKEIVLPVF